MEPLEPYALMPAQTRTVFPKPFLSGRERRRLGKDIIDITGCGPYDGGCLILATAMQRLVGGSVATLRSHGGAEHAVLDFHGLVVDFEGGGNAAGMIKNFGSHQMLDVHAWDVQTMGPREEGDFPNAPYSEEMVQAVMAKLPKDLGDRLQRIRVDLGLDPNQQGPSPAPGMLTGLLERFRARRSSGDTPAAEAPKVGRPGV